MTAERRSSHSSSMNGLPAFGPRRTTSIPSPSGQLVEDVTELGLERLSVLDERERDRGVRVVLVGASVAQQGCPHDEQKFAPASFS